MSKDDSKPADGVGAQQAIGQERGAPASKQDAEKAQAVNEFSKIEANGMPSMHIKIHSPFRDYYDGQAFSLSAENATGPFDVLPHHHNFISLLSPCEVVIRTVEQGDQRIRISSGLLHVKSDRAIVFLDV